MVAAAFEGLAEGFAKGGEEVVGDGAVGVLFLGDDVEGFEDADGLIFVPSALCQASSSLSCTQASQFNILLRIFAEPSVQIWCRERCWHIQHSRHNCLG